MRHKLSGRFLASRLDTRRSSVHNGALLKENLQNSTKCINSRIGSSLMINPV